jgi:hypothetical protein
MDDSGLGLARLRRQAADLHGAQAARRRSLMDGASRSPEEESIDVMRRWLLLYPQIEPFASRVNYGPIDD